MLLPGKGGRGQCGPGSLQCHGLVVLFHLGIPDWTRMAEFCCMPSFALSLQGDDGPDVRGGSGDILLVHATETDRKGAATPWAGALVLVTALGVGWPHRPRGGQNVVLVTHSHCAECLPLGVGPALSEYTLRG